MATTTNYGWTTPDDTDLVKNGALAIRTLGSAIDTSMNTALGTKKAGSVLLNTTSFSAVSSQSVNDVFSATYQHYLVFLELTSVATADADLFLKLRVSGTDSSTNYYQARLRINSAANSTTISDINNGTSGFHVGEYDVGKNGSFYNSQIDIINPFATSETGLKHLYGAVSTTGANVATFSGGYHSAATSYTGFTIIPTAGTMTGTLRIYGYQI